jgi:Kdo2-lipid IVA lauroyltransferase/acyltransferase
VSLLQRAELLLARLLVALLRALPPATASNLGGWVARTIGIRLPQSTIADANLRAAMPELSAADRARIIRGVWDNLGRTTAELPHIGSLQRDTPSGPGIIFEDTEIMQWLSETDGPVVFASAHIGNWEVLPAACAMFGFAFAGVYRASANPGIDALTRELRHAATGHDVPMFNKGMEGARGALAHLGKGGFLGLLVDQKMNDGIEVKFFGMPAMTAPALAALALRFRCPVVCGHVERIGPARFRVVAEPPLVLANTGDRRADIAAVTQQVNDVLERWIRAKPESWLWLHRRWPKDVVKTSERKKPGGAKPLPPDPPASFKD